MSIQRLENLSRIPQWSVSDRLRKARESAGYEQAELALMTGLSRATISAAENGHRKPSNATLKLWALATGVPVEWVVTGAEKQESPSPSGDGLPGEVRAKGFEPPTFCSVVDLFPKASAVSRGLTREVAAA